MQLVPHVDRQDDGTPSLVQALGDQRQQGDAKQQRGGHDQPYAIADVPAISAVRPGGLRRARLLGAAKIGPPDPGHDQGGGRGERSRVDEERMSWPQGRDEKAACG